MEPDLLRIRRGDQIRRIEPKGMALLLLLCARAPAVVTRAEIFAAVWDGRAVVDAALSRAVSLLRQALDDDAHRPRYIETIPTKGYRLIAAVEHGSGNQSNGHEPLASAQSGVAGEVSTHRRGPAWSAVGLVVAAWLLVGVAIAGWWIEGDWSRGAEEGASSDVGPGPRAIVVLPFANLSGASGDAYLATA